MSQIPTTESIGKPMGTHQTATEGKWNTSWAYLSRYLYHQPRQESQKCWNLSRTSLWTHDRRPYAISTRPNLGPSAKNLVYTYYKVARWFIAVVRHTYGVIYYATPAQNLKNLENLPRTTSGNQNLLLERQVPDQTSVQALNTLFAHGRRRIYGPLQ